MTNSLCIYIYQCVYGTYKNEEGAEEIEIKSIDVYMKKSQRLVNPQTLTAISSCKRIYKLCVSLLFFIFICMYICIDYIYHFLTLFLHTRERLVQDEKYHDL